MHWLVGIVGLWCVGCAGNPAKRPAAGEQVRPGIDVLLTDSAALVRGRAVGLVTNQAGVDAHGVSDVERLRQAGVRLVALFSPEHGFRGHAEPGEAVASSLDSATGLPIYSLYGRTSAPTDEMLRGLDVLLVDLQDAGARYYTYLSTTVEVMRAAARHGIPVVVLDRPNPIGALVQGNVLDPAFASPVGLLAIPMRHGMTLGELSRLARQDLGLTTALTVVPAAGWRRTLYLDQTGLPFIAPSPNLKSIEALVHYPGLCLFEGTSLSVGRGSDAAFEQVGAPWLDTTAVLAEVRSAELPGVEFRGVGFTPHQPGDGKFADTLVAGIRLKATDREHYDPTVTAVALLEAVLRAHPDRIGWNPRQFDRLAGGTGLREAVMAEQPASELAEQWGQAIAAFLTRRQVALIPSYGD